MRWEKKIKHNQLKQFSTNTFKKDPLFAKAKNCDFFIHAKHVAPGFVDLLRFPLMEKFSFLSYVDVMPNLINYMIEDINENIINVFGIDNLFFHLAKGKAYLFGSEIALTQFMLQCEVVPNMDLSKRLPISDFYAFHKGTKWTSW